MGLQSLHGTSKYKKKGSHQHQIMSSIHTTTPPVKGASPSSQQPGGKHTARWVVILLLVAAVVGFFIYRIVTARRQEEQAAAQKQAAMANMAIPVQVAQVTARPMPIYVSALGTVTPYYSVTVRARVTGELVRVLFREGQQVAKGQELATIDPRPYQAALDQARGQLARDEAQLRNNQAEYARYKALYDQGVVSKEQVETYQSNLGQFEGTIKTDQAALETAALNVQYCHITSPINGRVGLRQVDPGNIITANTTPIIIINQFQPIAAQFTIPEEQLPRVINHMRGTSALKAEAFDHSETQLLATGELLTIDNQIDTTTGTGKLKAVFPNKDGELFPNQFVNVHLILERKPDAITVPSAAVQHGTQGDFVWLVQPDKTAAMQLIKVDTVEGNTTIIASGLTPGQQVVTDGADKLRSGVTVVPHPMRTPQQAAQRPAAPGA